MAADDVAERLRRVEDRLALKELPARYALAVAKADVETLSSLFAPQGRFISAHSAGLSGEALKDFWRNHLRPGGTIPMVTNLVIRLEGDLAEADCTMFTPWQDGKEGFCGTYLDRFQRTPDGWRFLERRWTSHVRPVTA